MNNQYIDELGNTIVYGKNDYNSMIEKGFIPDLGDDNEWAKTYKRILELYKTGKYTDEEIYYIVYRSKDYKTKVYDYLSMWNKWKMVSMAYLKLRAQVGDSFPMLFFNLDMLYSSMRPRTNMDLFQTCNSNYYYYAESSPVNSIAVTRYASGMSHGLYHTTERPVDICGYFYYNEPESTTYLEYNTIYTSFNKTTACREMLPLLDDELKIELENLLIPDNRIEKHINGEYPPDLVMKIPKVRNEIYTGVYLGLYASEDYLDQLLCKAAKQLGYDIVVLTDMVGSHQVVTEVLDTRNDSFSHLWFKP